MLKRSALTSDLRRYGKAAFKVQESTYEITGNVRQGYSLWLVSVATFGPARSLIGTFSAIDELYDYVESQS